MLELFRQHEDCEPFSVPLIKIADLRSPVWLHKQINGESLSLKSDVFSLGSLLWELATSKIPFSGLPDDLKVIAAELNKPEPKLALFG